MLTTQQGKELEMEKFVSSKILSGTSFDNESLTKYLTHLSRYLKGRKGYSDNYLKRQRTRMLNLFNSGHFNTIEPASAA
jgi:hypothetical protein